MSKIMKFIPFFLLLSFFLSNHAEIEENKNKVLMKDLLKAYGLHMTALVAHQLTIYSLAKIALKMGMPVMAGQTPDVDLTWWPLYLGLNINPPEFQNKRLNAAIAGAGPLCTLAGCTILGKLKLDKISNSVRYFHIASNAITLLPFKIKEFESHGYKIKKMFGST